MRRSRAAVVGWQVAILVIGLSIWEWGWDVARATLPKPWVPKILDPYFISKPSAIWRSFLRLGCLADRAGFAACWRENGNNLWLATLVTLKNMCWGFLWGASFGALYVATGSLVAPAAAHAAYNLIALTYLRQRSARQGELS